MWSVAAMYRMRGGLCAVGVLGALIAQPAFTATRQESTSHRDTTTQRDTTSGRGAAKTPPALAPLKDGDGLLTVNVSCPVRHGRLNPSIKMIYVNRHPVGFC